MATRTRARIPETVYKIPLTLTPQPEGGYTVTSSVFPELITEGDTVQDALANVRDALEASIELYSDLGRRLPAGVHPQKGGKPIAFEYLIPGS